MKEKNAYKFRLSDFDIKFCTKDLVGNFGTFVYSHIYGNGSIQYLKLSN